MVAELANANVTAGPRSVIFSEMKQTDLFTLPRSAPDADVAVPGLLSP